MAMRTAFVGLGLLALLALAAIGAGGDEWGGGRDDRTIPGAFVDYAYTLLILGLIAMVVLVVDAFRDRQSLPRMQRPRGFNWITFFFALIVLGAYAAITNADYRRSGEAEVDGGGGAGAQSPPSGIESAPAAEFQWWLAILVGLLVTGFVVRERRRRRRRARPTAVDELEAVLTETLDDLELDPDPRRAVIEAYIRMEGVLAAHGHARLPHEAPLEYLARVLRALDVRAEAAHALTELFERARFSTHEIDTAMRAEAVTSLAAVRDDLRAAA
jgi:Domain of unknown function (DUF4129)